MFTQYGAALERACYLRRQCPAFLTNHYCSIHTTDRKPIRRGRRDSALPAPLLGLRSRSGQHNNFMVLLLADKNLFKVIGASLVPAPLRPDASSPAHPTQIRPSSSLIFTSPSFYWSLVFFPLQLHPPLEGTSLADALFLFLLGASVGLASSEDSVARPMLSYRWCFFSADTAALTPPTHHFIINLPYNKRACSGSSAAVTPESRCETQHSSGNVFLFQGDSRQLCADQ
ncbi:hypothetical protein E2C01_000266 [Portunus trituberculatus]|uniref:Uncharacterized protein n=1 Tax=Portunus trituberculatus TaxID=210409 RepID=A0A5B7CG17_PORTR|nr:hypothetical protein [Portunus trituberculatus]